MRPARVHTRKVIHLTGEKLRFAVVADTHSNPHSDLGKRIDDIKPDHILHAGDIGNLAVLKPLTKVAPLTVVRGNIDERAADLPDVVTLDIQNDKGTLLKILLLHIAVYGPKLRADVVRLAKAEDATLVVCGHSHVPFAAHDRGITVFNPGSVGPRRFSLPIMLGVVDIRASGVSLAHVNCETGLLWKP